MKTKVMNPYLPLDEYIPDGEPRIFGNRLYVYGSHDFAGGEKNYCPGDYMIWSAPLDDPGNWTCGGVGFARAQCPGITPEDAMAAPDVVQGPDKRYYLFFNTNMQRVCRVAVSDSPGGPFSYYGTVQKPDGTPYEDYKMFDPGVLVDEDGRIYLYTGFCMPGPVPEKYRNLPSPFAATSLGFELAADMKTIKDGPYPVIPGGNVTEGTGFCGHGFYEASSPRKIGGIYLMIYSSELTHELAYASAKAPFGPYRYEGVLISNADLGLCGNTRPVMPFGNNHGGLVKLADGWYVFYHRQTHAIECCRQGCAEKLALRGDGLFAQTEITSCGLNGGPLPAEGSYNACYCCHLTSTAIKPVRLEPGEHRRETEPYIFEDGEEHYIANIRADAVVGFKYFLFENVGALGLTLRGNGAVGVCARLNRPDGRPVGAVREELTPEWKTCRLVLPEISGVHALYIEFEAEGQMDFMEITFYEKEGVQFEINCDKEDAYEP